MKRWLAGWEGLSPWWKVALLSAMAWLPLSAWIILITSAAGDPLPWPLRAARALISLVAYGVIIVAIVRIWRAR